MSASSLSVAIQGERGSFSHAAALALLGTDVELVPCASFDALFEAARGGRVERALVPIENSLAGSIHENYDRLLRADSLHIVAEHQHRIAHCLIARPGASLASIRRVASHAVALAQCRRFFERHPQIEPLVAYDTAGSVQDLLRDGPATQAAIASRLAAELYGGQVLIEGVEDDPRNFTRFLLLSREPGPVELASKTSIVFSLRNAPGALYRALGLFADRGIDLSKIESRPLRGRPWEYAFYLDLLGDPRGPAAEALAELAQVAEDLRILGSYPDGLRRPAAPAETSADAALPSEGAA
jgi:prephenate dehydratase